MRAKLPFVTRKNRKQNRKRLREYERPEPKVSNRRVGNEIVTSVDTHIKPLVGS